MRDLVEKGRHEVIPYTRRKLQHDKGADQDVVGELFAETLTEFEVQKRQKNDADRAKEKDGCGRVTYKTILPPLYIPHTANKLHLERAI